MVSRGTAAARNRAGEISPQDAVNLRRASWKSMVQTMGRGARAQDRDAPAPYGTSNRSSEQHNSPKRLLGNEPDQQ